MDNHRNPQADYLPSDIPQQLPANLEALSTRLPVAYLCPQCHAYRALTPEHEVIAARNWLIPLCLVCLKEGKGNLMEKIPFDAKIEVKRREP